jgi:hypothetical protein
MERKVKDRRIVKCQCTKCPNDLMYVVMHNGETTYTKWYLAQCSECNSMFEIEETITPKEHLEKLAKVWCK